MTSSSEKHRSDRDFRKRAIRRYMRHYGPANPARMAAYRSAVRIRDHSERYISGRLLDIGCGARWKEDLVGDLVDEYIGLDHAESKHDTSGADILGTAYEIPQPDESFDSILCTSVMEHLEEPEQALRESFRVLKKNCHALYTVPQMWHLHEQPRDFFRYTQYALANLFRKTGFEIVTIEPLSGFWLTIGSELGYYALTISPRLMRPLVRGMLLVGNAVIPVIDRIDMRFNARSPEWTWMNLVVARRP